MSDYLTVVYDDKRRPYTDYPRQLANFLFAQYGMRAGQTFLEPGCGRGEMLKCFKSLGLAVRGNDMSPIAPSFLEGFDVDTCDVEKDGLPYPDNSFDVVFSKSFLEHFYHPEVFVREAYRVLKPGGLILSLVPDWEANYRKYFDDYTHRTPFSKISLRDIHHIHGFIDVRAVVFRQLPVLWRYPALNIFCPLLAPFIPLRTSSKLRWIRELMLIGSGFKPLRSEVS